MDALSLRPLRSGDEHSAARWGADAEFCRANDWAPDLSAQSIRQHWAGIIAGTPDDFLRLGVDLGGELVGHVDLAFLSAHTGEFGIAIERTHWRRGLGLTAGRLLLAHAFGSLNLQDITATVHAPNRPSHTLMLRLGFVEGGYAESEIYQGTLVDVTRYVLTRQRYRP
ncbi:GNAT family protein [Deinococcus sp.]|uniref:GNAT family N-acetyltransferase n=1 Tax=Deinococcus sp. TaxID=47478 RepID=UPI0025EDB530|nr:GNAT family protein [Deinococcus sp.]